MAAVCTSPLPLYRPRDPQASDLWRLLDRHFDTFARVYDERFQAKYGYWRPVVERSVRAYLRCGDLHEGFARVRCRDCGDEMFVAFSCKQRCTCPSCHQKRTLLTAIHVAEEVCAPVAHRQVVLTIPKRLRVHTRFDRSLLGKLCACAWRCILAEVRRALGRQDVVPGMIGTIQTHGELLHWHPHIHVLVTCGGFVPRGATDPASRLSFDGRGAGGEGEFLALPEFDLARLEAAWQEAVFALYQGEEKIGPEVVENMRSWAHSGFSVDQSVYLPAGDRPGIERLVAYMTRCPFSLSRLVKVTRTGKIIYKAEKDACRAFPEPQGDGLKPGPNRNFQVLDPLDFLAEFTQHIPPKGSHLIRYYGWYSNKARGMRNKAAEAERARPGSPDPSARRGSPDPAGPGPQGSSDEAAPKRASQTWAMLIKRVYEVDPLVCAKCGGQMKVVAFIEPPQQDVIEKILRHCGLWHSSSPRAPPDAEAFVHDPDGDRQAADEPREVTFVPEDAIWAETDAFLDADAFARDPADDWYREPADDEPREVTFVDEDTFWKDF